VQWSATLAGLEGKARIEAAMRALREAPPKVIGASPVVAVDDHLQRTPRSDVLVFRSQDGARLIARPSGTEPKIKFYLELVGRAGSRQEVAPARAALAAQAETIKQELLARLELA
jgi:phosphomannomutase